ncbi:MAG TPA: sugar phosphate isomerase/epimerase family protein [Bacillales bacterium]|nr:sugar phosphate isomerase/epimerase family protein [Bacillales bacterium]
MNILGYSTNMYGWTERWKRDGKAPDWDAIFRACAEASLDAVEIDASSDKLALARSHGLRVSATYVGLPLHVPFASIDADRNVRPFAERLAAAGGSDFLINADPLDWKQPAAKTESELMQQGENLSRIAEILKPYGLRLCMHNHAADRANAQGDLRSVTAYADPQVGLCVDIGWAHAAGCDPLAWARAHADRIFAFHFRNQVGVTPTEDLLEGEIDIAALMALPELNAYEGWLSLELWHPQSMQPKRTMTEDVRRSIRHLKTLLHPNPTFLT